MNLICDVPIIPAKKVDLFKQRMAAINARPARKVAEAKGRKKIRAVRRWEKLQQKAQTIAESADSTGEKMRAIEKMVKKTKSDDKAKSQRTYVVSKKGGKQQQLGKGVKKVVVDPRMKVCITISISIYHFHFHFHFRFHLSLTFNNVFDGKCDVVM
jgi:Fe2+ transport system protein B